jgi:uncharacterized protein (UPF0335 family)
VQKIERLEDEKTALEDDLCDDPENSEKFDAYPVNDATLAFAEHNKEDKEELKEVCNNYEDAEWNDGDVDGKAQIENRYYRDLEMNVKTVTLEKDNLNSVVKINYGRPFF